MTHWDVDLSVVVLWFANVRLMGVDVNTILG